MTGADDSTSGGGGSSVVANDYDGGNKKIAELVERLVDARLQQRRGAPATAAAPAVADDGSGFDNPLAAYEVEQRGKATVLSPLVRARRTLVKIRESPTNLHQVTAILCLDKTVGGQRKATYMVCSFLTVLMQVVVMRGISSGAGWPSCSTDEDCQDGFFCASHPDDDSTCRGCVGGDLGQICAHDTPDTCHAQGTPWGIDHAGCTGFECAAFDIFNARLSCSLPNHTLYSGGFGGSICARCFDPLRAGQHWNNGRNNDWVVTAGHTRMRGADFCAVVLVAMLVGLSISTELRDLQLTLIAARQHRDNLASWVRPFLIFMSAGRQFCLLPMLTLSVPWLVLFRGSDSLTICFNTVAVLFVLDVDNMLYGIFLPESTKLYVEDYGAAHIDEGSHEEQLLSVTKRSHVVLVMLSIVVSIGLSYDEHSAWLISSFLSYFVFIIGAAIDVFQHAPEMRKKAATEAAASLFIGLGWGGFAVALGNLRVY